MKSFSLLDIPEFSKKDRIVVVGVIGKSEFRYPNKTTPLVQSNDLKQENGIQCYWDERASVLYLHATTYLDTSQLTKIAAELNENSKSTIKDADAAHWLVASGELAIDACKLMALLFHLCHIVVLCAPTHILDLGYLQLFKAIDAYRTELSTLTTDELNSLNLGGNWDTHGRTCCPRLLFHFHRAPRPLKKLPAALKRLEHAVEDQLYLILRKARIITNVCAKSLFAIPKNEEFVYINADDDAHRARDVSSLVRGLVGMCGGEMTIPVDRPSFKQFLNGHIDLAFGDGFDDNVGKYAMSTSFFELPSASSWREAAQALTPIYLDTSVTYTDEEGGGALFDALATDVRFSQARCAKVLPIAQASYAEGLPSHYSSQHHAHKLSVALNVLVGVARGPLGTAADVTLRAVCAGVWRARSTCDAPSLTGRRCLHPAHDNSREHSSGVRYISLCDCGRTKCARDDPYSVRAANWGFYVQAAVECPQCDDLLTIDFPVFEPSTPSFRAASIKPGGGGSQEVSDERCSGSEPLSSSQEALSPHTDQAEDHTPTQEVPISEEENQGQPPLSRQASTTEYLPGLLHTHSPAGLLPRWPAWSLRCVGPSSLYSHAAGLAEHVQPGFLPHTNVLLPWDCVVSGRAENVVSNTNAWRGGRGRGKSAHLTHMPLTVKVFFGYEYECPRGHRFMLPTSAGGASVAASSPPLTHACPCRAKLAAQLMRLHVVTPKANVHVTLHPKVQPVPNGPIFIPQPLDAPTIKLTPSAYWILRFPFIYCDEKGPLPRPGSNKYEGKIVPPMFGLSV